jgi:aldose 1-epimerase
MSIKISKEIATRRQDREIAVFRLQNSNGSYVEISNYGATLLAWPVTAQSGQLENIILSYSKIEDYIAGSFYLGSTIGRYANRIHRAQFILNGKTYHLDKNDGNNSNHGGFNGFHSRIFDFDVQNGRLVFKYESPDGESGFPGNLCITVTYSFSEECELNIEYKAISDQTTHFNPANHAYFNLSGKQGNILDHELKVYASHYLETNGEFIPTGKIKPLSGTAFDFRDYRKISSLMPLKKDVLPGYNTYFIANREPCAIPHLIASLREQQSGRCLDVYSTMPGIQVYTGDYLSTPFQPFAGIALEAQFYPDAPNHAHFPSTLLAPGKEAKHVIRYKLHTETECFI